MDPKPGGEQRDAVVRHEPGVRHENADVIGLKGIEESLEDLGCWLDAGGELGEWEFREVPAAVPAVPGLSRASGSNTRG